MANFVHKTPRTQVHADSSKVSALFKRINQVSSQNRKTLSSNNIQETPSRRGFSFKTLISSAILFLLVVGGVSALALTQMTQDVRQQASGCTYWNGEPAVEGAIDNRGGIRQECKNGYWSNPSDGNTNPTSGTTGSGGSSVASSSQTGTASQCGADEIFCGGCISGCRKATQTCNNWIDQECKVQGCGGNGVFPASGEQCCSGLQQCANGRCAPSCGLDSNPICGGIREGSNCNNGGSWVCDSTQGGGSGHCEGGAWNTPTEPTKISCEIAGNIIYFSTQEACDTARKAGSVIETIAGGIATALNEISTTVSSTKTETHTERCDLNGTIVYVVDQSVCTKFNGTVVNGWVGPCCVGGEYKSLCRPEDRESTPANANDCQEKEGWVGPCCVDGEYKSLCRPSDRDSIPANANDCRASAGRGCEVNHATQCNEGVLYECMNEEWVSQGSCGQTGVGPFVQTTCYYAGSGDSCNTAVKYLRPDESCSDIPSGTFYDTSNCGRVAIAELADGDYQTLQACRRAAAQTPTYDHCWNDGSGYVLREVPIIIDFTLDEGAAAIETDELPAGVFATLPECRDAAQKSSQSDTCARQGDRFILTRVNVSIDSGISDTESDEVEEQESVIPGGNTAATSNASGGVGQALINGWNRVTSWVSNFSLSNLWGNTSNSESSVIPGGESVSAQTTCYSWNGSSCDTQNFDGEINCRTRGLFNNCAQAEQLSAPVEVVEPVQPVTPVEPETTTCYFTTVNSGTCYSSEYPAGTDCNSLSQGNVRYAGNSCFNLSGYGVTNLDPISVDQ